jgi:phage recombination protein Bet
MSNALQIIPPQQGIVRAGWEEKLDLVREMCAKDATPVELELYLYQARRTGLDPLARQIYFVKRKGKGTIQTGIDGYRLVADRTGKYAGNDDYEFDDPEKQPKWAKARVWKIVDGQRCPFEATARWSQYAPDPGPAAWAWAKMPHVMLGKCAEALALRKAFPAELSGMYTAEEMAQADREPNAIPEHAAAEPTKVVLDCEECGKPITAVKNEKVERTYDEVVAAGREKFDRDLCALCIIALSKAPAAKPAEEDPTFVDEGGELRVIGTVTESFAMRKGFAVKFGKFMVTTFSKTLAEELRKAKGKTCCFAYSQNGEYNNIERILFIGETEYHDNVPCVQRDQDLYITEKDTAMPTLKDEDIPF